MLHLHTMELDQAKQKARKVFKITLRTVLIAGLLFMVGYYFVRTYTVSEGNRSGLLFKVSKKGVIFKTYEGQLHLGGSMQITEQSVWNFSAKDAAIYQKLQQYEGKNVSCHYQELVNAFPWQGDTDYIVDDVKPVE